MGLYLPRLMRGIGLYVLKPEWPKATSFVEEFGLQLGSLSLVPILSPNYAEHIKEVSSMWRRVFSKIGED